MKKNDFILFRCVFHDIESPLATFDFVICGL